MNNENNMRLSHEKNARAVKGDARALIVAAALLAALIVLNLLFALLPATLTQFDTTENGLYTVSPVTKRFLYALDEDVTVYVVCEKGTAALMPRALLDRYEAASKHVKVKFVDPVADAQLLSTYGDFSSATNFSMVVVSDRRYSVVDFADCQYYYVEGVGSMTAEEYSYYYTYYYNYLDELKETYDIDLSAASLCFALEEALTGAIEYVTAPVIPHLYVLEDSGDMGAYMTEMISMVQPEQMALSLDGSAVPDNAAPLMIYAPEQDISAQTAQAVKAFLQGGGDLMLMTSPDHVSMPNLMSIVAEFGLAPVAGVLHEGNANHFDAGMARLLPIVNAEHEITYTLVSNGYGVPLVPNAHGIIAKETLPEGVSVTELFTTSDTAFVFAADGAEQTVGAVAVGVAAENATTGARLFWLSSTDALSDELIKTKGAKACAPYYLTMAMVWQSDSYQSKLDAIEPVDLSQDSVLLDASAVIAWSAVLVLVIPLCVLIPGIVIKIRRARK